jgi:hypothetical protein
MASMSSRTAVTREKTFPSAPCGYKFGLDEDGKNVLAPDPIQVEIVRGLFADRTRSRVGLAVVRLMRRLRRRLQWATAIVRGER